MTLVLLTGATRGIGRAAAIELARQGAEVALVGRQPERVSAVAAEARAAGSGRSTHRTPPSAQAQDETLAEGLWERSAELAAMSAGMPA